MKHQKTKGAGPSLETDRADYNPYGLHSIHIPLGLVTYPRISWGAKCLYGRLALFRGSKPEGFCTPGLNTLALAMNESVDMIGRWKKELIEHDFIVSVRHRRRNAEYLFLPHPCLVNPGAGDGLSNAKGEDSDAVALREQEGNSPQSEIHGKALGSASMRDVEGDVIPQMCCLDSANLPAPYIGIKHSVENVHENNQSSSAHENYASALTANAVDDDDPSSNSSATKGSRTVKELLLAFIRRAEFPMPCGKIPDKQISAILNSLDGGVQDLTDFLDTYHRRLTQGRPVAWSHVLKSFERWATEPGTIAVLRANRMSEIGTECRRAAASEKTTVMETPMDPAAAIREADDPCRGLPVQIPDALRSRLLRLGDPISPAAVVERARSWRRCAECRDEGFIGSSLAKTLDFCNCIAGGERRYCDGADGASREIARVHSSLKNSLVAAAIECDLEIASVLIDSSDVVDHGEVLAIVAGTLATAFLAHEDVERALAHLGLQRVVEIQGRNKRPLA